MKCMRAMILAAGKGSRLKPLTDHCPKPLVKVAGKPLIVYHLENLKAAGIDEIIINVYHLGEKIVQTLGNGQTWGVNILYSKESTLLEVGGGIANALPLLGQDPFLIVNGDIWTNYNFKNLPSQLTAMGHLVLVDNPAHHPEGDFILASDGSLSRSSHLYNNKEISETTLRWTAEWGTQPAIIHSDRGAVLKQKAYTYSGMALLSPYLFADAPKGAAFKLAPLLNEAIRKGQLKGEYFSGKWTDVGTLGRLQELENDLQISQKENVYLR